MSAAGYLLVVEDSDEDFDTLLEAARRAGILHEIRHASSGDECLQRILDYWLTNVALINPILPPR